MAANKKGQEKKEVEMILEMHKENLPIETIAKITKKSVEQISQIVKNFKRL